MDGFLWAFVGAIIGFLIQLGYSFCRERVSHKRELRDNDHIDVTGHWFAVWQTSVNNEIIHNTEETEMKQKGKTVAFKNLERSAENPKGGYLWDAELHFYHGRTLMGWYFPKKEENNSSKGIMYLSFSSQRKIFLGKWVGAGYDGELTSGLVVIAKDRARANNILTEVANRFSDPVNIVFDNLIEIDR